jgi:hypothetical protein
MRYRALMKKPAAKLVIRRETLRTLAGLDLTRVIGGEDVFSPASKIASGQPARW